MADETTDPRPRPQPDDATEPYWAATSRGELCIQRCAACGHWRFPPRPMCPRCHSMESAWPRVSGRGTLYSWVVCHPPLLPAFAEGAPYAVVLVELEEDPGLRLVGNLTGCPPEAIRVGLPLEVWFEPRGTGLSVPQWRRRM